MASAALRSAMQQPDVFAPGRLPFGTQVPNTLLVGAHHRRMRVRVRE